MCRTPPQVDAYSANIGVLIPSFQLYFLKKKLSLPLAVPVSTIVFRFLLKQYLKVSSKELNRIFLGLLYLCKIS